MVFTRINPTTVDIRIVQGGYERESNHEGQFAIRREPTSTHTHHDDRLPLHQHIFRSSDSHIPLHRVEEHLLANRNIPFTASLASQKLVGNRLRQLESALDSVEDDF